jgi:hypothetical protein
MTNNDHQIETASEATMPFSRLELRGMLRAPLRTVDLILGARGRFAANIAQEHRLPTLLLVLAAATAAFALPFGAVLGLDRFWRVAALLMGALGICVPSLHVFAKYLGAGLSWAQTLALALAATAVTSLFTFAFAPIVAFMRATMTASTSFSWENMAVMLLICAVIAGIGQLIFVLRGESALRRMGSRFGLVLIPWLVLYFFVTVRLATVLGLIA